MMKNDSPVSEVSLEVDDDTEDELDKPVPQSERSSPYYKLSESRPQ